MTPDKREPEVWQIELVRDDREGRTFRVRGNGDLATVCLRLCSLPQLEAELERMKAQAEGQRTVMGHIVSVVTPKGGHWHPPDHVPNFRLGDIEVCLGCWVEEWLADEGDWPVPVEYVQRLEALSTKYETLRDIDPYNVHCSECNAHVGMDCSLPPAANHHTARWREALRAALEEDEKP